MVQEGAEKTMVAKMIAQQSGMNWAIMSGGDISQFVAKGEHVFELNRLFEKIKNSSEPTILFIDEIESLCRKRSPKGEKNDVEHLETLNAFLSHTGEPSKKLMVIGATNMEGMIDSAVLSRMDHKLEVKPPGAHERVAILSQYFEKFFTPEEIAQFFDEKTKRRIGKETEGLTGRALFKLVNALHAKKSTSDNNMLNEKMIFDLVNHFIKQEVQLEQISEPKKSLSWFCKKS